MGTMEQIDDPRGELAPGSTFAQAYRVVRVIAEGGMGTVYEVTQANTGQRRALKVLHLWLADDERVRQRFVLEARVSASIESDHVVQVVDAGIAAPGNVPWYVMEYLEGETLAEHGKRRGPLPPLEVLEIFEQLGHGVGAAHQRKVVHCDLKPDNLHIAASRRADAKRTVKVLDFGIANVIPELKTYAQLTRGRGTPGWLAPEQFAAQGQVSAATDVWALGLIAFWLLTGGSYWKFYGKYPAVLMEIEGARLESATARAASLGLRGVPPKGFDEWFSRCLDRDPAQRFRDATEAVDALRAVLAPTESPRMSAPAGAP